MSWFDSKMWKIQMGYFEGFCTSAFSFFCSDQTACLSISCCCVWMSCRHVHTHTSRWWRWWSFWWSTDQYVCIGSLRRSFTNSPAFSFSCSSFPSPATGELTTAGESGQTPAGCLVIWGKELVIFWSMCVSGLIRWGTLWISWAFWQLFLKLSCC